MKIWLESLPMTAIALCALVAGCDPASVRSDDPDPEQPPTYRSSRTFTTDEDFLAGATNGVGTDTAGQLQMSTGAAEFSTPYLWVPDSAENKITLVDTVRKVVVGTYELKDPATGEPCYNPSRTTVDFNWDVWVGCRGTNSYCNRGSCPNGEVVPEVDNKVMKLSFRDGSVLLSVRVGNGPRALALDANNHLWIGCSVDDTIWEIDGDSGHCYRGEGCTDPPIAVPDFPYGSVVDSTGMLWTVHNEVATNSPDELSKINVETGQLVGVYGPYLRNGCNDLYGICIDLFGYIWLGGFACSDVVKVDPNSGQMVDAYPVGGETTRGVAVDLDSNIWAASSTTGTITKLNGLSGELIQTVNVGATPIGVAVDAYGHVWAVSQGADAVTKINGVTYTKDVVTVGRGPYTYSDMLGLSLRQVTLRNVGVATWRAQIDSGRDDAHFLEVSWNVDLAPMTAFGVRVRCAATAEELATAAWSDEMTEPGPVDCGPDPQRWLEVEARFMASGTSASPVLYDLTVYWE
ncbi:MAG: hypothetical protein JXR83_17980 [Deltaproteobacteria bacterium]|nr:hypothetical protein [Deltaproteobacteria bacterium]